MAVKSLYNIGPELRRVLQEDGQVRSFQQGGPGFETRRNQLCPPPAPSLQTGLNDLNGKRPLKTLQLDIL
jgi:hypothetical protein